MREALKMHYDIADEGAMKQVLSLSLVVHEAEMRTRPKIKRQTIERQTMKRMRQMICRAGLTA
jgi:hypothetical protein